MSNSYTVRLTPSLPVTPASKYDLLLAKRDALVQALADLDAQIGGLDNTPADLRCHGCGEHLATEGEFARHFVVRPFDVANDHLNLGWCPVADRTR